MPSLAHSIKTRLGIPVLADIPLEPGGAISDPPGEPFLEGVRFVRAGLQTLAASPSIVTIVPVRHSILAMTVARYIARSFAEAGRRSSTVLLTGPVPLPPLLDLPGGADLPTEAFLGPSHPAELAAPGQQAALIVYCPPDPSTLSRLNVTHSAVLLVDESCSLEAVKRSSQMCAVAGIPVIAAAVMTRPRTRRWPFSLLHR